MLKSYQKRNAAILDNMDSHELDAYALQNLGVRWNDADKLAMIGAKLTRHESISDADVKAIKAIYPHVAGQQIDRVVKFVNSQPPGPNRLYSFTAHLSADEGAMRASLEKIVSDYATHEISEGVLQKRAANAPRDANGQPLKPTQAPPRDPMSTRSLLEGQMKDTRTRELLERVHDDPDTERFVRDRLADTVEAAQEKLDDGDASLRDHLSAAFTQHGALGIAEDAGLIDESVLGGQG